MDVVVIGERDHGRKAQAFDLSSFKIEGQHGSHGRRPVAARVVQAHAVLFFGVPLHPGQ